MKVRVLLSSIVIIGLIVVGCENTPTETDNYTSNNNDTIHTPLIIKQPLSSTITIGETLLLTVGATGGNLKYQWRKNNSDISNATDSILNFPSVKLSDDNSEFTVTIYNDSGLVTSDIALLTVQDTVDSIAINDSLSQLFQDSVSTILSHCGTIPTITPSHSETILDTVDDPADSNYEIYNSQVNSAESWSDLNTMGKNDDILYPGALIDGGQLYKSNTYTPLLAKRAPITISISLEGTTGTGDLSTTINDPKLSSVRNGIRDLIIQNQGSSLPVKMDYSQEDIYSENQMGLALDIPLASSFISNSLGINWSSTSKKTKRIYTIKQVAYSVDLDTPDSLFTSDNKLDDINSTFSSDIIPTYVGSVEYGAVLYVVVESDLDYTELDGALGTFTGGNSKPLDSSTSVKIVQYGGSGDLTTVAQDMIKGGDGLDAVIAYLENQDLGNSLAVPLSYTLRYASTNTIAHIGASCSYTKEIRVKSHLTVTCVADSIALTATDGNLFEGGNLENLTANLSFFKVTGSTDSLVGKIPFSVSTSANSKGVWARPNRPISVQFKNFSTTNDNMKIILYVSESDAQIDDTNTKIKTFKIDDWNGSGTIDVATNGPDFKYYLSFSMN